jgi:DNA-binding transcriptional ArsR family regulator
VSDEIFDALGDPTRRKLVEHLGAAGPESASALARVLPVSRQAIVKHLAQLEDAGLVSRSRRGRSVEFHLVTARLDEVTRWTAQVGEEWSQRLSRLQGDGR